MYAFPTFSIKDIFYLSIMKLPITDYGTFKKIKSLGYKCKEVSSYTEFNEMLDGRVKTLHPKIFGVILARKDLKKDNIELAEYDIPTFDLVIVDLYPFEDTVKSSDSEEDIIEKIDIGGISLIRAAAKNFNDVLVISHINQYTDLLNILKNNTNSKETRKLFAEKAFNISSHYDTSIFNYFNKHEVVFKESIQQHKK